MRPAYSNFAPPPPASPQRQAAHLSLPFTGPGTLRTALQVSSDDLQSLKVVTKRVLSRYAVASLIVLHALLCPSGADAANTHAARLVRSSNQYFSAPDSPSVSVTGDLTIEAWVKLASQPSNGSYTIVSKSTQAGNQASFFFRYVDYSGNGDKRLDASISANGASGVEVSVVQTLPTGQWTHVAMVYAASAGAITFYVNGLQAGTTQTGLPNSIYDSPADLLISGYEGGSPATLLDGQIDDVRLWGTTRTRAQINAAISRELVGNEPDLRGYWKLNNSLTDSTANGNTLINHGFATFESLGLPFLDNCTPLPLGCVAWWPGNGNADDIQGTNNGTLMGGATFAPANAGQGFSLDKAMNAYIRIPSSIALELIDGTIEVWVKPDWAPGGNGYHPCIVGMRSPSATRYSLHIMDDYSAISVFTGGVPAGANFPLGTPLLRGQFYHLALVQSNGNMRCYLNGTQVGATELIPFNFAGTNLPLNIGSAEGATGQITEYFTGIIDELSIYDRPLSEPEIRAIHDAGSAGKCKTPCFPAPLSLVAWWPGDGDVNDIRGTNDGTNNGASFAEGQVGRAFSFDGSGGHVSLPDNLFPYPFDGNNGDVPFTFETWFRTTSNGVILGQQNVAPFVHASRATSGLYVGTNGKLYAEMFYNGTRNPAESTSVVNDGNFHHAGVTYDGTNMILYLDGMLAGQRPQINRGYTAVYKYQLGTGFAAESGNVPGGWFNFNGLIDEPRLYDRALSPAEIAAIHQSGSTGSCQDTDTDGDRMPDSWELQHGLNPLVNDANDDIDFDGLTNLQEYRYGLTHTNQLNPQTLFSQPGVSDYWTFTGGGSTNRMYYDRIDRLIGLESSRGVSFAYQYDGNGNLVRQTVLSRITETNGLPVLWSFLNGLTSDRPSHGLFGDADGDGWSNYQEWKASTSPTIQVDVPKAGSAPQTPPIAQVLPADGVVGALALVLVRLWDAEGSPSLPELQFQTDGSTNWTDAVILFVDSAPWSTNSFVIAPPTGMNHVLCWNAATNFPPGTSNSVWLRARATDITTNGGWSQPVAYRVEIPIGPHEPPRFVQPVVQPDGSFHATLEGQVGGRYIIQASTNLVDWGSVTNVTHSSPTILFRDPAATNLNRRFYRVVSP